MLRVRIKFVGIAILVWSAYFKRKGPVAMEEQNRPLPPNKEMPVRDGVPTLSRGGNRGALQYACFAVGH